MKEIHIIRRLRPLLRRFPGSIAALVALGAAAALAEGVSISLFLPLLGGLDAGSLAPAAGDRLGRLLAGLFDGVAAGDRVLLILGSMFGLLLLKNVLVFTNGVLLARMCSRLVHDLRARVFDRLLRVEMRVFEQHDSGKLLHTLERETWDTSAAAGSFVGILTRLCTILVFTAVLLLISWKMTALVAVALGLVSVVIRALNRRAERLSHSGQRAWSELSRRILESLRGMRTIRLFGRERMERDRFTATSRETARTFFHLDCLRALIDPATELLVAAVLIVVLFTALRSPGNLPAVLTFLLVLYRLQPQVQRLEAARLDLIASTAPVDSVMGWVDASEAARPVPGTQRFGGLEWGIELRSVGFRYEAGGPWALHDISARIPARRTTAIVGPSGAGKSTLIHLLLRLFDPDEGCILADGTPLPAFDTATWRARIAVVSQDIHVWNASILDNIRYGRLDATEDDAVAAARIADAHGFIAAAPGGYGTVVGDEGMRLSGGQRQRIALARAIIRDPDILVLDEATNALDSISESVIQDALATLGRDRTVLIVAHRLATIERADRVIVLDGGRVREQGRVHDLLRSDGLFARLHGLQTRESTPR